MRSKRVHRAFRVRDDGSVSALCFAVERAIDLKRASWTLTNDAVTCPRCRRALKRLAEHGRDPRHSRTQQPEGETTT